MIGQVYNILMRRIKLRQNQNKIFDEVQAGNMIWCKMPLTKKELNKIEKSHRIRPYLVVRKEKNCLLCYQSSSKNREELNNYEKYCISSEKYKNEKSSWLDLTSVKKIKIKDIQLTFIKLNQLDIKKIEKRLCIGINRGNNNLLRFNEAIYIEEGDIVAKDEKNYYVYAEDNVNVYGFRIQKRKEKKQKLKRIIVNRKTYYTNFKEFITIKRKDSAKVMNIAYQEEMLQILEQKKLLKENTYHKIVENIKRDMERFEIGSVFQYGNSTVMYLYTRTDRYYGVDLLWYSVRPRIFEIKEIHRRRLIGTKDLEEINKVLEFLLEKNVRDEEMEKVYQYVRNLLFSSVV